MTALMSNVKMISKGLGISSTITKGKRKSTSSVAQRPSSQKRPNKKVHGYPPQQRPHGHPPHKVSKRLVQRYMPTHHQHHQRCQYRSWHDGRPGYAAPGDDGREEDEVVEGAAECYGEEGVG
mmetsp:Transcript_17409/g.28264  ORF Transcript_17409/g.28264 Transcript_17409/m.28264 type:complete len:122 (-) Transcript_17409:87-452(-)